ncbi:MAG: hypothetical protein ACYSRP_07010 [Planctomycetota bacterium]|jgi:hypothetical protein
MSKVEKLTVKFNKTKVGTVWLILAATVMIVNSTAYADMLMEYYESGQLEGEANFKNGAIISQKKYDEDGNLESKQAEVRKEYYPSGQLEREAK